jgi:hypothetical protein
MSRWPRFRFSLKMLLAGVILVSVGLATLSLLTVRARQQAAAVADMQRLGATIYYDFHHYYDRGGTLDRWRKPTDWKWARKLLGNDYFSNVYMVEFVEYRDVNSNGKGITTFLGPVPVPTDISRNADRFVRLLEFLPDLRHLDLQYSEVSDRAIPSLATLKTLEVLWLANTKITRQGAERLGKLLPNCKIQWWPGSKAQSNAVN